MRDLEDMTGRRRAEALHAGQEQVLAMVATDAPLGDILATLLRLVESQVEGLAGSVLLLDEDGQHARHAAAPSLPESYVKAIDGEPIGPRAGSGGTAMYRREPVIVTDILADPLWAGHRELAARHGLRACWATPILTSRGKVLGSFAMYYCEVRGPSPEEERLAEIAAHMAAIAIERRQAEDELRSSRGRLTSILDSAMDAVITIDPPQRIVFFNAAAAKMFACSREEMLGQPIDRIIPERFRSSHAAHVERFGRSGFTTRSPHALGQVTALRWNGEEFPAEASISRSESGGENLLTVILRDVTARKQAEQALRASEERFSKAFRGSPIPMIITRLRDHVIVDANDGVLELLGYTREEVCGRSLVDLGIVTEEQGFEFEKALLESGVARELEVKVRTRSREERLLLVSVGLTELEGERCTLGAAIDITERKRVEKVQRATFQIATAATAPGGLADLLREVHRIVAAVIPSQSFSIALHDPGTDTVSFPYYVDEVDPPPAARRLAQGLTEYVLRTGRPLHATREVIADLRRRGELVPRGTPVVDWVGVPLKTKETIGVLAVKSRGEDRRFDDHDVEVLQFVSTQVAMAIDRRRAEDALRESEETHRSMVENAPYGIFRSTPEGRFLTANPALVTMLGYDSKEDLLRLDIAGDVFKDPEERDRILPTAQPDYGSVETTWRRRDGRAIAVMLEIRPVLGPGGKLRFFEVTVQDVTQQRALEAQLRQSQKMEAVGRLAGGVAHDFNNLLTAISGYSGFLLESLEQGDPRRADVLQIRKAANQAGTVTQQLLAFSRKQVLSPKVMDLNALIGEMERLLRRVMSEDVTVVTELQPALARVRADPGQLQQVVLNLVMNARDAMPAGGRLTLRTANFEHEAAGSDERRAMKPGKYVVLAVSDTGMGMDEDTRARIFEPFFTTKESGKGTGLGLATVYGVVKQSGGYIWVKSAPGRGATFEVYLPRDDESLEVPPERAATTVTGGRETLLLVEDATAVRAVARAILERVGYVVLEASTGLEAVAEARRHVGPIHLLVTDVVMPGMNGPQLAGELREIRPGIRVLYVSGYADEEILRHGMEAPWVAYLPKPFTPDALARKVREVLDLLDGPKR